jgi:hypothetical protein
MELRPLPENTSALQQQEMLCSMGFVLAFEMSPALPQPTELKLSAEDECSQQEDILTAFEGFYPSQHYVNHKLV